MVIAKSGHQKWSLQKVVVTVFFSHSNQVQMVVDRKNGHEKWSMSKVVTKNGQCQNGNQKWSVSKVVTKNGRCKKWLQKMVNAEN